MKKYLFWICAAVLLTAGASCSDDPEVDSVGRVAFQQESLTADGAGQELTLNVTSNAYWRIVFVDPSTGETIRWITTGDASGIGNAEVTLNVARNRSTSGRSAYVNVITESESSSASILLSQGAGTIGGGDGYPFPIYQMFSIDANLALDNAFIEGMACYFDDGMILRRTGSAGSMVFSTQTHTNPKENWYFQRGVVIGPWETGDALVLEIPVREDLSGNLRYTWGSRRDNAQSTNPWTFWWSADGENWTRFDGLPTGGASDAVWKTIDFTIPADKKIPAGGKLWIRHLAANGSAIGSSSNKTIAFQTGICITKATAEPTKVPAMNDQTVVFSTGFDDVIDAKAAYIDLPLDFMSSWNDGAYPLPVEQSGIVSVTSCWTRPGFLQVGRGDEAFITRYTQGAYTIKLASRFEKMRISQSDLKLTFLASAMIDAYGKPTDPGVVVKADAASGATVEGGVLEGVANNEFKSFTVYVRNAKPETEITITSADMTNSSDDVRFFLDDILLEVEGEPQRPGADDPVKADVSAIRAMKGAGAVTIADNYYIEGRVVAVDNVPADCFAVQDADAGIFVKLAGHSFAVGDQVEVVVKDARLAADADGLLVVTPTAADKVTKTGASSETPAARAVSVAELKAGTYEAMLVTLPESQVVDADLAKNMGNDITLELEDMTTTYTMKTYASASFAASAVPQKRGAVKGLGGASFLLPTSPDDLAGMTGTRFGQKVYAIKPIDGMLKMLLGGDAPSIYNATYDAASMTVTYKDNGSTITKLGNTGVAGSGLTCKATPYDGRFTTTGWGGANWQENALLFKIKATSVLKGNLRFGFGLFAASSAAVPHNYRIEWSTDNTNWNGDMDVRQGPYTEAKAGNNLFSIPTSANAGAYKMALFNIPESKAVPENAYLYIRIRQADTECHKKNSVISTAAELQFQHAFYLSTHEKRAYHTSDLPSGADVVLTEGFDDAFYGHDYFIPTWQMCASTNAPNAYIAPEGWEVATAFELPGYIRLGSSRTGAGSITTPPLEALGEAQTDITVSFKIAIHMGGSDSYEPDETTVTVTAGGAGTAGVPVHQLASLPAECKPASEAEARVMEDAYYKWYPVTVTVTGATKATRITIAGKGRHYIDDIVITKN